MRAIAIFACAGVLEIAGCFCFWLWLRQKQSLWFGVLGAAALVAFGVVLTRADTTFAGRAFAAYGGIYIAASVMWLWSVEGTRPDRWDLLGASLCILGAAVIALARR